MYETELANVCSLFRNPMLVPTNNVLSVQEIAPTQSSNTVLGPIDSTQATQTIESIKSVPCTVATTAHSRNIPKSQLNSIYNVNDSINNSSSVVAQRKLSSDSNDLYQQQLQNQQPQDPLPSTTNQLNQSNLLYDRANEQHPTLQRLTTLPPQKQLISANNAFATAVSPAAVSPPAPPQLYSNRAPLHYDVTMPMNTQAYPPQLPSPKIINRDVLLNNSRFNSNLPVRHNGVHRKHSDTDIVGEMNHLYKQSMFARRTGIEEDSNPFHHCVAPSPLHHRDAPFNRFGYDTANRRKIGSPLVNRKLSPPFESTWNMQRHAPNYQYGGSISASPSPNMGGRKLTTTEPLYWDSQHVRLQGNTSPIGE